MNSKVSSWDYTDYVPIHIDVSKHGRTQVAEMGGGGEQKNLPFEVGI